VGKHTFNWRLSYKHEDMDWDVMWSDNAVDPELLAKMKAYQKINHFPGMYALARKNHLARNLTRLRRLHPADYDFFPKTWLLPAEYAELKGYMTGKKRTFIVKPEASCQGRGIFLTRKIEDIKPEDRYVVQQYLSKPLLIDDFKFDLRIYVLVAGCDPLRIFVHEEGLARLATEKYSPPGPANLTDMCMHLTNYAVNKANPNFIFNADSEVDDIGHKRSLTSTMRMLSDLGYDVPGLWTRINDMIVKTLCAVQPSLAHTYRSCQPDDPSNGMCFELLGLDVILDHKFRPYLLEVNHSPSFTADTPLDRKIKRRVIAEALELLRVDGKFKRKFLVQQKAEAQERALRGRSSKLTKEMREIKFIKAQNRRDRWENQHLGGFTKIYPKENDTFYLQFIETARTIWNEWTGGRKQIPQVLSRAITPQTLSKIKPKVPIEVSSKVSKLRSISNSDLPGNEDSGEDIRSKQRDVFDRLSKPQTRSEKIVAGAIHYAGILPIDPSLYRATTARVVTRRSVHQPSFKQAPALTVPKTAVGLIRTLHQAFDLQLETMRQPLLLETHLVKTEARGKQEGRGGYLVPRVMSFTPKSQGRV
jgi:tubulin polyglutamylase TTLL6/13